MTEVKEASGAALGAVMADAVIACMRSSSELHSRLTAGWLELVTRGIVQPSAAATWTLEAMRLTAETTLRNIEHCQHCARRAAGDPQ